MTAHTARSAADPVTDEEKAAARTNIKMALAKAHLVTADHKPVCPSCGTSTKGKIKLFDDGGFKCHKCKWYTRNALDMLCTTRVRPAAGGWLIGTVAARSRDEIVVRLVNGEEKTFPASDVSLEGGIWPPRDAIAAMLGREYTVPEGVTDVLNIPEFDIAASFEATPDPEVYEFVLSCGDVNAAIAFYGRFGIAAAQVIESRATRIVDQNLLVAGLRDNFGPERVISSGLASESGYLLVNDRYPVVEPHLIPDGQVAGLQFRGSEETEARVKAHKVWAVKRDAIKAAGGTWRGDTVPHTSKFLSLRGAPIRSRCGFGLPEIAAAANTGQPRTIWIVEGFKDMLAARTFGMLAYGLPGAGVLPVRAVCDMFKGQNVRIVFDGDEAGNAGAQELLRHLASHEVTATVKSVPDGKDICDLLMEREGIAPS
jgi:hypothetical protein